MTSTQATIEMLQADLNQRPAPTESALPADGVDINWNGIAHVLRELRVEFAEAADGSEKLLMQHPLAVAVGALVVGFAAGRILAARR